MASSVSVTISNAFIHLAFQPVRHPRNNPSRMCRCMRWHEETRNYGRKRRGELTLKPKSVIRRRPRLQGQARVSSACSRGESGGSDEAGFSREVNWAVRPNKGCRCVWVHTSRALRVDPAVRWPGDGATGYPKGRMCWGKTRKRGVARRDGLICRRVSSDAEDKPCPTPAPLFARYLAHVHFLT